MKFFRLLFLSVLCLTGLAQQADNLPDDGWEKEEPLKAENPDTAPKTLHKVRAPRRPEHAHGEIVKIGAPFTLKAGESVHSIVVIGSDVTVEGEADEVVVISGSATILGSVRRSLVVVLGQAELGPKADVSRDLVVIGGPLKVHPDAKVTREPVEISLSHIFPKIQAFNHWFASGLMMGRPLPLVPWAWTVAGIILAFYMLLAALFPRPVAASVESLQTRPASSLLAGILGVILFGPVCFLLAVSVIGLPAIPILFCCMVLCVLFGKTAFLEFVGQRVSSLFAPNRTQSAVLCILLGGIVISIFYMVPFVGFFLVALTTLFGFGAVLLAFGRGFNRERPPGPGPVAVRTGPPPIVATASVGEATVASGMASDVAAPPLTPDFVYFHRAGFWIRLCAAALDLFLLGGLGFIFGPFTLLLLVAYHIALWTWKSTTIGGIVLGLKIVRTDGQPINFAVALVRGLASVFSAAVLFLGFFWAGWDREKQSWHDKIAGTVIVRVPKGMSLI